MDQKKSSEEFIPVTEAADRLGVTLPRLLRTLKRPTFQAFLRREERKTRTGIRTVTLINVSVFDDVRRVLQEARTFKKYKQETTLALPLVDPRLPLLEQLVAEQRERIREQQDRISDLTAERNRLLEEKNQLHLRVKNLTEKVEQNQQSDQQKQGSIWFWRRKSRP